MLGALSSLGGGAGFFPMLCWPQAIQSPSLQWLLLFDNAGAQEWSVPGPPSAVRRLIVVLISASSASSVPSIIFLNANRTTSDIRINPRDYLHECQGVLLGRELGRWWM